MYVVVMSGRACFKNLQRCIALLVALANMHLQRINNIRNSPSPSFRFEKAIVPVTIMDGAGVSPVQHQK